MATHAHSTPTPAGAVVPFPGSASYDPAKRGYLRKGEALPEKVVRLHPLPEPFRLPDTPERAFIRALGRQMTAKAFTGVVKQLGKEMREGNMHSKLALMMILGEA